MDFADPGAGLLPQPAAGEAVRPLLTPASRLRWWNAGAVSAFCHGFAAALLVYITLSEPEPEFTPPETRVLNVEEIATGPAGFMVDRQPPVGPVGATGSGRDFEAIDFLPQEPDEAAEFKVLKRVNEYRTEHQLPEVKMSPVLMHMARRRAAGMAHLRVFHDTWDGKNGCDRLLDAGYKVKQQDGMPLCVALLAFGNEAISADRVLLLWTYQNSQVSALKNAAFEEAGVAIAVDRKKQAYVYLLLTAPQ